MDTLEWMRKLFSPKGHLLVELVIAIGLTAVILPALLYGFFISREEKPQQEKRVQAVALMKETETAVRSIRDTDWANLTSITTGAQYHPVVSGNGWAFSSGTGTSNGLTQAVVVDNVYRDSGGAIVANPTGNTLDPSTKKVTITISWVQPQTSSVTTTLYLTRTDNITHQDTTTTQFGSGTSSSSAVLSTTGSTVVNDGQVQLGAGGGSQSDWCAPNLSITPLDLPKNGVANAITAIEGRVFAGTGDNASGVSFANVSISNAHPPAATSLGTVDGYKTNDIFGENNYAYFATDNNTKEIEIISLSSLPYAEAGSFNAPGNGNGNSVFVTSNYGFMTSSNKFYNFRKVGSSATIDADGVTLAGTGNNIYVVGNYAYVANSGTTNQLQIINLSNPSNLSVTRSISVNGQGGIDVYVNPSGTRAYLATGVSSTQNELFIVDVDPSSSTYGQVKGSYDSNGMSPKGVTVVTNNKAILVGTSAEEYQVLNIINEASPTRCGGINIDSGVNGVSSVLEADGDVFSYIITGDASSELKIIEGGAGAAFSYSGTFESPYYDAEYSTTFNRIIATVSQPSQTTIKLRVAVAAPSNNICSTASYDFVGPGGTTGLTDYYYPTNGSIAELIPYTTLGTYQNPGKCFKYKVWFDTTDATQTPVLYDIIVNHSL